MGLAVSVEAIMGTFLDAARASGAIEGETQAEQISRLQAENASLKAKGVR